MLIGTKTSTTRMDKWVATCSYNGTSYKQRWKNYCYMAQYEWPQKYNVLRKKQIAEKFILNGSISYLYFKIKHYLGTYICVYIWMYVCVCIYIYICITTLLILEKVMATHSSVPAWRIPWTEQPGGLRSMGSHRVRHDWVTLRHATYKYTHI